MFIDISKKTQQNISFLKEALLNVENNSFILRIFIFLKLYCLLLLRAVLRVYAFLFFDDSQNFFILTGIEKNNFFYTQESYCVYKRFQKKTVGFGRAALAVIVIASVIGSSSLYMLMNIFYPDRSMHLTEAAAGGWLSGWTYTRAVTLSSATTVANYQVKVTLTAANFDYTKLSFPTTGDDLRFTGSDGTTSQDYWIETWVNGGTSTIWVEVAASGTSTIYMYYGNTGASAGSSGTNTFIQWHGSSTADYLDSAIVPYVNVIYEAKARVTSGATARIYWGLSKDASYSDSIFIDVENPSTLRYLINTNNTVMTYPSESPGFVDNQFYKLKIVLATATYRGYIDDNEIATGSSTNLPNENLGLYFKNYGGTGEVSYAFVRQYVATEPAASLGTEEYFDHFTVTGTATMNAGASQVITITAKTNLNGTYTGYTGDKSLTFSGANISGGGNNPTCSDKTSTDVNFGTATTVTFASGVGTCTMKLYNAEIAAINVTDGTKTAAGNTLSVTVGSPLSGAGIQINGTDSYTISKDTTLTLAASNASSMKFSNNNSSYSAYEAYGTSKAWDITNVAYGGTSGDGAKTVYVIFKDAYGNEAAAVNDNIVYDTTVPVNPSSAIDAQGAVTDTWQNNKNDPNFTSFTGASDTNGIEGYYVYFDTSATGTSVTWVSSAAYDPASFISSNTRYLRVLAKDNAGNYADPDGAGATCTNTNSSRPADPNCWATIFIHKYDIDNPNTPSPVSSPASWTNTNSFDFSWTNPGDIGGSGVKDYTYQTNAGTSATTIASLSVTGLTSNANGTKLFSVKANDNAGNSGADGSSNFYYDNTPPTNAGVATDGNGSFDDTWGIVSDSNFTWVAGTDSGDQSGVKEYDVYWGTSSTGTTVTVTVASNAYNPAAIPANTPYYLRIRTRDNALNESAWATIYIMKYSQAASSPSGLSQTANSASLALGDWTNDTTPALNFTLTDLDSDTLGYVIKIDNNSDFSSPEVFYTYSANDLVSGVERSFTVGQAAGTGSYTNGAEGQVLSAGQYYWKVKAVESHNLASSEVTANGGAVAFGIDTGNPTGTTLGFGAIALDSITVNVSGAADSGSGLHITPYFFDNTTAITNSGWQTGTTWDSNALAANTRYTFQVTARDKAGNIEVAASQNKYTLANQVMSLSAANATDKTNYKINLTWTDQSQSGLKIEQDTGCNGYETTLYDNASINPSSPYSVSVAADTCYQFRIFSYNGDGILNSTAPIESSQITSPAVQPVGLTHTANTIASIDWDWADAINAIGYKVYRASDDTLLQTIASATSNWTEDTLAADTQYSVYVRATSVNGEGIASSSASAYTSANVPVSPSHSANTIDSVAWSWATGGAQKDFYAWTDTPAANSDWITGTGWNQSSLSVNTLYTFFVKARNEDLNETNSASSSAYSAQNIPTGISFDAVASDSITISAIGSFSNLGQGSSGLYFLNFTNSNTPDWTQTNFWINSSLSPNTQYSYRVKSRNGDSDETSYTADSAKYTLANFPAAPTVNNAMPTTLDVNPNPNSNPASTEFAIYKETGDACDGIGGSYIAANGSDNGGAAVWQTDAQWGTTTVTGLAENTQYYFCVEARNGELIESAFGASASGTTTVSNIAPLSPVPVSPANGIYIADITPTLSANYYDQDLGDVGTTNYRISFGTAQNCLDNVSIVSFGASSPDTPDNNEDTVWTPSSSIGSDGTYYWCAQNNDGVLTSNWVGMGNFVLDTVGPTGVALGFGAIAANSITVTVSGAMDSGSGLHSTLPYYFSNITAITDSGWQAETSWMSESLTPNTQYAFKVKSKDVLNNESDFTLTQVKYTLANIPSGLSLTPNSQTQITASWSANSNPSGTQYYAENITAGTNSGWINSTSWASANLSCGEAYSFHVKARNSDSSETLFTNSLVSQAGICPTPTPIVSTGGGVLPSEAYNPPVPPPASSVNPQAGFRISINDGAVSTGNLIVSLTFIVGPDIKRMAVSESSDFSNVSSELFQPTKTFVLSAGNGVKTVYAKFYTQYGTASETVSDSIIFDSSLLKTSPEPKSSSEVAISKPTTSPVTLHLPEIIPTPIPTPTPVPTPTPYFENNPDKPAPVNPNWNLIDSPKMEEFSSQPNEISFFTQKIPFLSEAFKKLGISQVSDIASRAPEAGFNIPKLSEIIGGQPSLSAVGQIAPFQPMLPIASLSVENKAQIPSEIFFVSAASEKINIDSSLVLDEGSLKQKISTVSSTNLNIAIKADHPARSISGYLALKKNAYSMKTNYESRTTNQDLISILHDLYFKIQKETTSFFALNAFAQEGSKSKKIETRFVLAQFQYVDPDKDGIWTADIQAPAVVGEYEIISLINYQDQNIPSKEIRLIAVIDPEGYVYRKEADGVESRLPGVSVSIYSLNSQTKKYALWPAQDYDQKNPQTTDATGKYSFLVPAGSYYLKAEASGYYTYQSDPFTVSESNNVHMNLEMKSGWSLDRDWKTILLILFGIALVYNFYKDRRRKY